MLLFGIFDTLMFQYCSISFAALSIAFLAQLKAAHFYYKKGERKMKRILTLLLSMTMLFTCVAALPATTKAATKPVPTSITSLTPNVKGFKVKWKKKSVSGYQLQVSTNSKFKKAKKVTIKKATTTSKKVTGLSAKKRYYVRVRTFKTKNSKTVYSKWSKSKSVVTKAEPQKKTNQGVYITPTGKKYHFSKDCAGPNAIPISLSDAQKNYEPCKKCANG